MSEGVKRHLKVIVLVTILGIACGSTLLVALKGSAGSMNVLAFDILTLVIPCFVMFVCAVAIMMSAEEIGTTLLMIVEVICFVCGMASLVVTSGWQADPDVATALLANSAEDATITPSLQNVFAIVRGAALFLFVPMIGSILGAWIGSRLHPVSVDKHNKNYDKLQQEKNKKKKAAKKAKK